MPTGYTTAIADDITFREFALNCARAFGALIVMRDDPADAPIPETFQPSTWAQGEAAKNAEEIKRLQSLSAEECEAEAKADYDQKRQYHEDAIQKDAALKIKYEAMLAHVEAWTPPTQEHQGVKDFMREQIQSSIEFDCGGSYHQEALGNLRMMTGEEWRAAKIEAEQQAFNRHTKAQGEENERTNKRNAWVKNLRDSLPA